MTDQHPIAPPPELLKEWIREANHNEPMFEQVAKLAAAWGSDMELEACCEWIEGEICVIDPKDLFTARRPKPPSLKEQVLKMFDPICECVSIQLTSDEQKLIVKALESLKEQALQALKHAEEGWRPVPEDIDIIRHALEQLDD